MQTIYLVNAFKVYVIQALAVQVCVLFCVLIE